MSEEEEINDDNSVLPAEVAGTMEVHEYGYDDEMESDDNEQDMDFQTNSSSVGKKKKDKRKRKSVNSGENAMEKK